MSPNLSCQRGKDIVHFELHRKRFLFLRHGMSPSTKYTGVMLSGSEASGRFTRVKKIRFFGFASE
jgi:hypothetical protein